MDTRFGRASLVFGGKVHEDTCGREPLPPPVAPLCASSPEHLCVLLLSGPCQAMVSNPHSLGLQAIIYEDGYTYDGNTKHRMVSCAPDPTPAAGAREEGHSLMGTQPTPATLRHSSA